MSDGLHGHNSQLYASLVTNPTSFTNIGNVISITGPSQTRDAIEKSTMDSTSKFREFIPGMLDAGETTFDVNYDGSAAGNANTLDGLLRNTNTAMTFWINFWDGTSSTAISNFTQHSYITAPGLMTALGHAIPFDDKITQPITIKLSGVPTFSDLP